jgi:hypothetical protein
MAVIFVRLLGPRYRDLIPRKSDVSWVVGQLQSIGRRRRLAPADVIDTPKGA